MRRLVRLLALGGLVLWVLRRRAASGSHAVEGVTIGYADGGATLLEAGSRQRELLIAAAGGLR